VLKSPSFYGLDSKKDTKHNQQIMEKLRPDAYKILKSKIIIQAILKSSLFRISVEDSDAHRAHELAMAIAEAYQEYDRLFRVRTTINAYQKIKVQREKFEKMHSELQRKLMQFRQTNNVLTTSLNDRRNLAFKRLDSLYQQMIQVILRRVTLESQLQPLLRSRKSEKLQGDLGSSFPPLLQNELYWKLKHRHSDLQLKLESMSSRYKSKHPEVERLENQLRRLNKIIIGHIALIIEGYQEQLRSTKREEKELISKVNIAKTQLKNLDRLNLTFEQLQKEEQELSKSLSFLNRRYFEIQLLKDSTATNVRVVERASQPKDPFSPRVFRDTAIGIVLSFVGLLGLFMLIELLDRSVRSLDDLEKKVGIIPLGEMPLLNRKKKQTDIELLYNPERPMTQVEEAIRAIRTNILFTGIVNKELRKILLTSPSPREGKTFLAINLAIGIAHTGKKTILIDTDMRRPRIHKVLLPNFDRSKGVSSVIVGQHSIDEAIIKTQFPNLWLLPCGPIPPSPTELLQTDGFHKFMDEVLERFDIVLFDSPPIIPITDASILASYVDGVILVSSCGITTWNALQASVRKIQSVRGKLIGCILNKFSNKYRRYHYGYYGSYGSYKTNYGYSSNEET
jgi:capsular exopolysaccharide synthesis family protein